MVQKIPHFTLKFTINASTVTIISFEAMSAGSQVFRRKSHANITPGAYNPNEITNSYLLTYLLTPWSRVILEKLTGSAASQEIPRIFGTRMFLTVPTSARHLSQS